MGERGVIETMHLSAEHSPFVMLPRWLLYRGEVSDGAKLLYCVLHDLVVGREGPTRPVTRAQLGSACRVSVDTVDRRLAELVAVGAVEKHAQVISGGQAANIYQVWLTPPEGLRRQPLDSRSNPVDNRGRSFAAPVEGCANSLVNRSREFAAPPQPGPQPCGNRSREFAAPSSLEEQDQEIPPQPPRRAGGPDGPQDPNPAELPRRANGTNPRANGTHPRGDEERGEAERLRTGRERAQAEIDAQMAARREESLAATRVQAEFLAEQLALSAVLDDELLAGVVDRVRVGLPGPLARSPFALARNVAKLCRRAHAAHPGGLVAALSSALVEDLDGSNLSGDVPPVPLAPVPLAPAPPGTPALQKRIQAFLHSDVETTPTESPPPMGAPLLGG